MWEAVAPSFLHRVLRFPQVAVVGSGFQPSRRRTRPEAKETREVAADRRREAERGRDARSGAEQRYLAASHPILHFFFFLVGYNSYKILWLPVSSCAKLASATAADCKKMCESTSVHTCDFSRFKPALRASS